jgi:hypothetical protein
MSAFFLILGAPVSGYFLGRIFLEAKASASWPSVVGTVTKAQVVERIGPRYFPDVTYSYQVDGRGFTGTRLRASHGDFDIREAAAQAIDNLAVGQEVPVYYDPINPSQSVLQAGADFREYALLCVPVGMLLLLGALYSGLSGLYPLHCGHGTSRRTFVVTRSPRRPPRKSA